MYFNIKTASFDGHDLNCGGPTCPIAPQKNTPIRPFQMMYEPKARFFLTFHPA